MGVCWIVFPPKYSLGRGLNFVAIGFFLVCALAFLPLGLFGTPGWRVSLAEDLGLPLSNMLTPQPWMTLEGLMHVGVGLLWLFYLLGQRWKDEERIWASQAMAIGIGVLASLALVCHFSDTWISFWGSFKNIGPFPNRNHFGTILAMGAVLCATCSYDLKRTKSLGWVGYLVLLVVILVTIIVNNSRAGVLLFFVGLGSWLAIVSLGARSTRRLAVAASFLILCITAFFVFGGGLMERFMVDGSAKEALQSDGRIPIYQDCADLLSQNPLFGIGLGNFEGVFAISQKNYNFTDRVIHPESDWVWLSVETGLVGLALAIWLLLAVVRRVGAIRPNKQTKRRQHRFRMGAAAAALIVPIHGIFDVPGHVFGTLLPAMLLISLAVSNRSPLFATRWPTHVFRGAAIPVVVLGVVMTMTHFKNWGLPSREGAKQLYGLSVLLSGYRGGSEKAFEYADRASEIRPLFWEYHFQKGLLSPRVGRSPQQTREDFRRARFLEQRSTFVTVREAEHWMKYHPPYVVSAWRETLLRDPSRQTEHYHGILKQAAGNHRLTKSARALATLSPRLKIGLLNGLRGADFEDELARILEDDPNLDKLNDYDRQSLFKLWAEHGDRDEMVKQLSQNAVWEQSGWMFLAENSAERNDYTAALRLVDSHYIIPKIATMRLGGALEQLENEFYLRPNDIGNGLRLYYAQVRNGKYDESLRTLDKLEGVPGAPDYLGYLRYKTYRDSGNDEKAWEAFKGFQN